MKNADNAAELANASKRILVLSARMAAAHILRPGGCPRPDVESFYRPLYHWMEDTVTCKKVPAGTALAALTAAVVVAVALTKSDDGKYADDVAAAADENLRRLAQTAKPAASSAPRPRRR